MGYSQTDFGDRSRLRALLVWRDNLGGIPYCCTALLAHLSIIEDDREPHRGAYPLA